MGRPAHLPFKTTVGLSIGAIVMTLGYFSVPWLARPAVFPAATAGIGCTKEARACPDGTAVGRVPPSCQFAPCPTDRGWRSYSSPTFGFSLQYPVGFTVNQRYAYAGLGSEQEIPGVAFTVPASLAAGTNLSADTYLSVERLGASPIGLACDPLMFLPQAQSFSTVVDGGVTYLVAVGGGAAAGNRYEETVYLPQIGSGCTAIRYLIHSTNLGNYEPGTVREFDRAALLQLLDGLRRSYQTLPLDVGGGR